jgi:hypothetical protein
MRTLRALGSALLVVVLGYLASVVPARGGEGPEPDGVAFFESKVRPILVERCYSCHSSQARSVRGGLLLDTREGTLKGGDIGPAVEPGNPDESLLVQAVRWDDDTLKMPPAGKLPEAEIAILTEWARRGAPDPRTGPAVAATAHASKPARVINMEAERKHWAFQPLKSVPVPEIARPQRARHPIDLFVLAKLDEAGIEPNPEAPRATLIRRLSFDITGLPPAPEDVDAFVADASPDAYEKLVDRLLASPAFGERWARHWLDLARYAESHGFEHDYDRPSAYTYRDFLIEALNRDLPYDRFVQWQLAGDELAPADPLAMKATGFLAAGAHSTQITISQAEKERYDELDDMVNTTGTAFLGLTLGCARCHDHKYDPVPTLDYYRLAAVFTTTVRSEQDLVLDPEGDRQAREAFDQAHAPLVAALEAFERDSLPSRLAAWEKEGGTTADAADRPWRILDLTAMKSAGGATMTKNPDGSVLVSGTSPDHEVFTLTARTDAGRITGFRLEAMSDPSLARNGPGRAPNGNFALSDFQVTARPLKGDAKPARVKLVNARATFEQAGLAVASAIDDDGTSAWAVDPQFGRDHAAAFDAAEPITASGGVELTFKLTFTNNLKHAIGRPRLAITSDLGPVALDAPARPQAVDLALATPVERRSPEQSAALASWYRTIDPEYLALANAVAAHAAQAPKPSVLKALICSEGVPAVRLHTQGPDFYETTYLLRRGDLAQKVGPAEPGFLQALSNAEESTWKSAPPEGAHTSHRRAALARWITDTESGAGALTARVAVNRLWQHAFGRGIVATPSDFGTQGDRPTHPELLEWLAADLVRGGWRLKPVLRQILLSDAYRRSSHIDPKLGKADPSNDLLARQNRRRLEAEPIRDAMLAVSGLLDRGLYGPGTLDESMTRRSIYFGVKRSRLVPMMALFDAPDTLVPIAVRPVTTVAPQGLFLLNDPQVRRWSEALASRVSDPASSGPSDAITRAYRLAFGRVPDAAERDAATSFLARQAASGESPASALADFCQALLCTNEFIYVE